MEPTCRRRKRVRERMRERGGGEGREEGSDALERLPPPLRIFRRRPIKRLRGRGVGDAAAIWKPESRAGARTRRLLASAWRLGIFAPRTGRGRPSSPGHAKHSPPSSFPSPQTPPPSRFPPDPSQARVLARRLRLRRLRRKPAPAPPRPRAVDAAGGPLGAGVAVGAGVAGHPA